MSSRTPTERHIYHLPLLDRTPKHHALAIFITWHHAEEMDYYAFFL